MIVVIDNYDSFTWNLVQQLERLSGERVSVCRNDEFEVAALLESAPRAIVVSPGPGHPARAGRVPDLIRSGAAVPLLGVCLGHQAIAEALGGNVTRANRPVHGKIEPIEHNGKRLFRGCPARMPVARYHSLVIDRASIPADLLVDAETDEGLVMAVSHRHRALFGVQFHPESYGTRDGDRVVGNFLAIAGITGRKRTGEEEMDA